MLTGARDAAEGNTPFQKKGKSLSHAGESGEKKFPASENAQASIIMRGEKPSSPARLSEKKTTRSNVNC